MPSPSTPSSADGSDAVATDPGSDRPGPSRAAVVGLVAVSLLLPLAILAVVLLGGGDDEGASPPAGVDQPGADVEVGEELPDFVLPGLDGGEIRLSDFRGEPLVLTFFASWCNPCEKEMPVLQAAHDERPDEFGVLAVSYNDLAADSRDFVADLGVTFPVALDTDGDVKDLYGVHGIPQSFFVDADGRLVKRVFGITTHDALEEPLSELLAGA